MIRLKVLSVKTVWNKKCSNRKNCLTNIKRLNILSFTVTFVRKFLRTIKVEGNMSLTNILGLFSVLHALKSAKMNAV